MKLKQSLLLLLIIFTIPSALAELPNMPVNMPDTSQLQGLAKSFNSSESNNKDYTVLPYQMADSTGYFYLALQGGIAHFAKPRQTSINPNNGSLANPSPLADESTTSSFVAGLSGGYIIPTGHQLWLPAYSFGLNYDYFGSQTFTGSLNNNSSDTQYFAYNSNISSQTFLLTGQFDLLKWHGLRPFLRLGTGIARNKLASYQFTDKNYWNIPSGAATFNFAYQAAGGLSYHFNRFVFSALYAYTRLGTVSSGKPTWQNQPTAASFAPIEYSLSVNEILAEIQINL